LAFAQTITFDLDDPSPAPSGDWSDYVRGVTLTLEKSGYRLKGADIMLHGDLPIGSGLSASASLEVSTARAFCEISGVVPTLTELALLCQRAENDFVGMRCGVMDQFAACNGVADCALLLDCRSLEARPVRVDPRVRLVICNTMVHHELATSAYNTRRAECERAVSLLSIELDDVRALRDVSLEQLERHAAHLPETIFRRARHVVSENARTLHMARALEAGDLARCGRLMNDSHRSLRDDYEVSCAELDLMAELARGVDGVYGSRMTGGGFGGCTVSLVEASEVDCFREIVGAQYEKATGLTPSIFCCTPASGVGEVVV
jgi:galactokinase